MKTQQTKNSQWEKSKSNMFPPQAWQDTNMENSTKKRKMIRRNSGAWYESPDQSPQASHSPLPWKLQPESERFPCSIRNDNMIVADVHGAFSDVRKANAAYIVLACNGHAVLVNQLAMANKWASKCQKRAEKAQRLADALKRIAFEPQGEATASHAEVLRAVENIAREALAQWNKESPADADALEALDQLEQLEGGE